MRISTPLHRFGTLLTLAVSGLGALASGTVQAAAPPAQPAAAIAESPATAKTYDSIGEVIHESIFGQYRFPYPDGRCLQRQRRGGSKPRIPVLGQWVEGACHPLIRGGGGFRIPYAGDIQQSGVRSTFNAALAVGYYFTEHDFTPIGDMVWYVATNFNQALDNRAPSSQANFSVGPGFRTHVGNDWYLLGAVDVPVVEPKPYDYQVLGGVMKVY